MCHSPDPLVLGRLFLKAIDAIATVGVDEIPPLFVKVLVPAVYHLGIGRLVVLLWKLEPPIHLIDFIGVAGLFFVFLYDCLSVLLRDRLLYLYVGLGVFIQHIHFIFGFLIIFSDDYLFSLDKLIPDFSRQRAIVYL